MIEFSGTLDRTLYRRALSTKLRSLRVIAVLLAITGAWGLLNVHDDDPSSWGVPLFVFLFGIYCLMTPWLVARNAFRTSTLMGQPFTGRIDENVFVLEMSVGRTELPWTALYGARVTPELILVFLSNQQFYILARRFFANDADWEAAREIISTRVPKK